MKEDLVQSLRSNFKITCTNSRDCDTIDHRSIDSKADYEEMSEELSWFFDLELSNRKYDKAKNVLHSARGKIILSRHALCFEKKYASCADYEIEWM